MNSRKVAQRGCSYFGNRMRRWIARDMTRLAAEGFTFVMHVMSEFDLSFRKGNVRDAVSETHDAGLEAQLDPWGVGNVFGGEPFSNFAAQHIFDACQVLDDGKPVPMACPNAPLFRDYMKEWIGAAVYCGADTLFWDEAHFHSPRFLGGRKGRWGCRCDFCREKFQNRFDKDMPAVETDELKRFKKESILEFIDMLTGLSADAGRRNVLYLSPEVEPEEIPEAWSPYARLPHIDVLGTGPYWQWLGFPLKKVGAFAMELKRLCDAHQLEPQLWIQACMIKAGTEEEIARAAKMALEAGIANLAAWAFDACAHESWISCEDPEKAWETVVRSFQKTGA